MKSNKKKQSNISPPPPIRQPFDDPKQKLQNLKDELNDLSKTYLGYDKLFDGDKDDFNLKFKQYLQQKQDEKNITFSQNQSFYNRNFLDQEIRRGIFLSKYIDSFNYDCQPKFYQQILTREIQQKTKNFNKNSFTFAKVLQKIINKKKNQLNYSLQNLQYKINKMNYVILQEQNRKDKNQVLRKQIESEEQLKTLYNKVKQLYDEDVLIIKHLQSSNFKYGEKVDGCDKNPQDYERVRVQTGCSQKVVFEKIDEYQHKKLEFISEKYMEKLINYLINKYFRNQKIKQLVGLINNIPQQIFYKSLTNGIDTQIDKFQEQFIKLRSKEYKTSQKIEDMKLELQRKCYMFKINQDVNINNNAQYLQNIEILFINQFQKQNEYFQYNLVDNILEQIQNKNLQKNQRQNLIIEQSIKELLDESSKIKLIKCYWLENLSYLSNYEKANDKQRTLFYQQFNNNIFHKLVNEIFTNQLKEIQNITQKKMQDFKYQNLSNTDIPAIFYDFYQAQLKLDLLSSRSTMIKLLNIFNVFRSLQKKMYLMNQIEFEGQFRCQSRQYENMELKEQFSIIQIINQNKENVEYRLTNPSCNQFGTQSVYETETKLYNENKMGQETVGDRMKDYDNIEYNYEDRIQYDSEWDIYKVINIKNEQIMYEASIYDLIQNNKKYIQLMSFYSRFYSKKVINENDFENLDDDQDVHKITQLILQFEHQFQSNKLKLILLYQQVLEQNIEHDGKQNLIRIISDLMAYRPQFENDENKNTIFEIYKLEIIALQQQYVLVSNIIKHQESKEQQLINYSQLNQEVDYYGVQTTFQKENVHYLSLYKVIDITQYCQMNWNVIVRNLSIDDQVKLQTIKNLYYKQIFQLWNQLIHPSQVVSHYLYDFRFLYDHHILDKPYSFNQVKFQLTFKKLNIKLMDSSYIQNQSSFQKDSHQTSRFKDSQDFKQSFNIQQSPKKGNTTNHDNTRSYDNEQDETAFDKQQTLEKSQYINQINNFLQFYIKRHKLCNQLVISSLQIQSYKDQIDLLDLDPLEFQKFIEIKENVIQQRVNLLNRFFQYDKLQLLDTFQIENMQNWSLIVQSINQMNEFNAFFKSFMTLQKLIMIGLDINNLYINDLNQNKISHKESKQLLKVNFFNIFKTKQDLISQIQQIDAQKKQFMINNVIQSFQIEETKPFIKDKDKKQINITNNRFKDRLKSSLSSRQNSTQTLLIFADTLLKDINFQMVKVQAIINRQLIIDIQNKLPFEKKLFDIQIEQYDGESIDQNKDVFQDYNIFVIPKISDIINQSVIDYSIDNYEIKEEFQEDESDQDEKLAQNLQRQYIMTDTNYFRISNKQLNARPSNIQTKKGRFYYRKRLIKDKSIEYLEKSQLFLLNSVLYYLQNILHLTLYQCLIESNSQHIYYFNKGMLNYEKLELEEQKNKDKNYYVQLMQSEKEKTNLIKVKDIQLKIKHDIENVQIMMQRIQQNIQRIKNNPKIIMLSEGIFIYMQKLYKKQFYQTVFTFLAQINVYRSNQDNDIDFLKKLKFFSSILTNKDLNNVIKYNEKVNITGKFKSRFVKHNFQKNNNMMKSKSKIMNFIDKISHSQDIEKSKKFKTISQFYEEQIYDSNEFLQSSLLEIQKSKRTQIASVLTQIKSQTNELMNRNNIFENENVYAFERFQIKALKENIRVLVMKEFLCILDLNILPLERLYKKELTQRFQNINHQIYYDNQEQQKIVTQIVFDSNQVNKINNRIADRIEMLLLKEGIDYYKSHFKFIEKKNNYDSSDLYFNYMNNIIEHLNRFNNRFQDKSIEIQTINKGEGKVVVWNDVLQNLSQLKEDLDHHLTSNVNQINNFYMNHQNRDLKMLEDQFQERNVIEQQFENTKKQVQNYVFLRIQLSCNDHLYRYDEMKILLQDINNISIYKEQKLKDLTRKFCQDDISSNKIMYKDLSNRFQSYKQGMNCDLKDFIDDQKENNLKNVVQILQDELNSDPNQLKQMTSQFKNGVSDISFLDSKNQANMMNLFQSIKTIRIFYQIKEILLTEKFQLDEIKFNENKISNQNMQSKVQDLVNKTNYLQDQIEKDYKVIQKLESVNKLLKIDNKQSQKDQQKLENQNENNTKKIQKISEQLINHRDKMQQNEKKYSSFKKGYQIRKQATISKNKQ